MKANLKIHINLLVSSQEIPNGDGKLSYFEAHPEWFGLRNGKRSDRDFITASGDNFNTSNKDANKELAKKSGSKFNKWFLEECRCC